MWIVYKVSRKSCFILWTAIYNTKEEAEACIRQEKELDKEGKYIFILK